MAGIEIAELKDALSYAEYQLSKTHADKDQLQKDQATNVFQLRDCEDRLRKAEEEKEALMRDIERGHNKIEMIENNQVTVSRFKILKVILDGDISWWETCLIIERD